MRLLCVAFLTLAMNFPACAGTFVQFRTAWGDMEVELFDQDKPITVQNFLRYVQSGRYRDSFFHRCPTNQATRLTHFVVQGGGFFVTNQHTINAQFLSIPTFGTISNEFGVGRRFSNVYGTIAMAKVGGNTNSASSQWFFNLADNSFLDAPDVNNLFTVFGRVVRGTNVLDRYLGRSVNNGIQNLGGAFSDLPVTFAGARITTYDDLEYVDISLLNVQVRRAANGGREITWNSVSGRTNHVEFTTTMPPAWQSLITTNGTGLDLKIVDESTSSAARFYRVRVDY